MSFRQLDIGVKAIRQHNDLAMSNEESAEAILTIFLVVMCLSMAITAGITAQLKAQFRLLCELVMYISSLSAVNLVFCRGILNQFGIRSRTSIGFLGILFAPFLHVSWVHLIGNMIVFLILGWLVMLGGTEEFLIVTVFTALVGGFGTWLLGRDNAPHVGASGVIFGYLGFLLLHGYFENDSFSVILSVLVGSVYFKKLTLISPTYQGISWESHLFGLVSGVLAANQIDVLKAVVPV